MAKDSWCGLHYCLLLLLLLLLLILQRGSLPRHPRVSSSGVEEHAAHPGQRLPRAKGFSWLTPSRGGDRPLPRRTPWVSAHVIREGAGAAGSSCKLVWGVCASLPGVLCPHVACGDLFQPPQG